MNPLAPANLAHDFCDSIVALGVDAIGPAQFRSMLIRLFTTDDITLDASGKLVCRLPEPHGGHVKTTIHLILTKLEELFGKAFVDEKVDHLVESFEKEHIPVSGINAVEEALRLLPEGFLKKRRTQLQTAGGVAQKVKEKTWELEKENTELEFRVAQRTESLQRLLEEKVKTEEVLLRQGAELRRANDQLKTLDQAKSDFISVVAHQLRTPLSAIKWTLSMLQGGDLGVLTDEQKTYILKTSQTNDHMINLVGDLLDANSVETGQLSYNFGQAKLADIIQDAVLELTAFAKKRGIQIVFSKQELPVIKGDPERLHGAFQNLIDNAIKYSKSGGTIAVSAELAGDVVRVSVADQGIGIPEGQEKYIFQRFFRGRNAIQAENGGTGLGLFIVKKIIEDHGGTVRFQSRENVGTTFVVDLPVAK